MAEIFDRRMFNRLYFEWFSAVYRMNPETAIQADKQVIPKLGKKMAQIIKEEMSGDFYSINYLFEALKKSHWFQENVELVDKKENYMILQTRGCNFQKYWVKNFDEVLYCPASHKPFLEEFCKEINPNSRIENLVEPIRNPKNGIYCAWKISI